MIEVRSDADPTTLAALRRAWTEEDAGGPIDDPDFEARFDDWWGQEAGRRSAWAALVDGEPVGMLTMAEFRRMPRPGREAGRWGYIANVFVSAAHRNADVGRVLLDASIAAARERRYVRIVLAPSLRSVPFYRRAGFLDAADGLFVLPLG